MDARTVPALALVALALLLLAGCGGGSSQAPSAPEAAQPTAPQSTTGGGSSSEEQGKGERGKSRTTMTPKARKKPGNQTPGQTSSHSPAPDPVHRVLEMVTGHAAGGAQGDHPKQDDVIERIISQASEEGVQVVEPDPSGGSGKGEIEAVDQILEELHIKSK